LAKLPRHTERVKDHDGAEATFAGVSLVEMLRERFNCTLRQRVSRRVRATLSFSKKLAHHIGAIKYFICHDNLTRHTALPG
jgi:hypothetical protein